MIRHFIIMSYAYPEYKRIAFDIIEKDGSIQYIEYIDHIISNIREKCNGDAPFSTHSIPADDENWESVVKADPYFRDVAVIDDFDEFMNKIIESRKLKGTDVENYIINKITPLTHLQLQKLCYFCYADYLCETKKKLFPIIFPKLSFKKRGRYRIDFSISFCSYIQGSFRIFK